MNDLLKRYEELFNRLDKSDKWLIDNNYKDWEEVRIDNPKTYQLRNNLIMQITSIQKVLHEKQGMIFGD